MTNYQRINANSVALGENQGQPSLASANDNKLNVKGNIVANDDTPVITYTDSSNTIDFHNKPVVNFSGGGGGGGGDAFLNGGTALVTPQEFTGFNRFDNDTQFADGILFSDDGTNINGKIHATASQLHIETNNVLDTISMKLAPASSTNTLELKQDPSATTQNALFIQQDSTSSTLDKVLTNSTQDLGVIVDAVEASPNTFTNTNTFSASTTTTGITNTGGLTNSNGMVNTGGMTSDVLTCQGLLSTQSINSTSSITSVGITNTGGLSNTGGLTSDVMTCQGLLSTQSLNASQNITGNQVLSNGDITCGVGSNFIVGSAQIASGNLSDSSSLLNTSATQQTKAGNLIVNQLTSSAGVLNFDTTGGANIQNDTTANVLLTSTTNATDSISWRLGTSGNDSLVLRYDPDGGGAGIPRYFLEMLDPSTSPASYFQLSGNSGYDVTSLIALLNNTSLTFNPTTTLSAQGTFVHIGANALLCGGGSNGTLNIGLSSSTDIVNIEASVNFDGTNTHTFGANSTVLLNGTTTLASGVTDIGKSGVTYGVFGKLASLSDKSDTDLNPTRVTPTLVSPLTASTGGWLAPCYVYNRKGTNGSSVPIYEVVINGNVTKSTNWDGNGDQTIFTLPVNFRPDARITYRAQGRGARSASRIDILDTGEVLFVDGGGTATTYTELSLSGISFYANI